jgi:hypothetical protein
MADTVRPSAGCIRFARYSETDGTDFADLSGTTEYRGALHVGQWRIGYAESAQCGHDGNVGGTRRSVVDLERNGAAVRQGRGIDALRPSP